MPPERSRIGQDNGADSNRHIQTEHVAARGAMDPSRLTARMSYADDQCLCDSAVKDCDRRTSVDESPRGPITCGFAGQTYIHSWSQQAHPSATNPSHRIGKTLRTPAPNLLIRSYLHRVQRRPDQSVTWHDRQPLVRTRPPAAGSRSPGWLPGWLPPTRERKAGSATIMGMCGEW
jgi:hypothetical protein